MALTIGSQTVLNATDKGIREKLRIQRHEVTFDSIYAGAAAIIHATTTQGDTGINEVQTVTIANAAGGTFTLTADIGGAQTTAAIAYNATAAAVKSALEALSNIGVDDITVNKAVATDGTTWTYTITFINNLAATNITQLTSSAASLTSNASTGEVLAPSSLGCSENVIPLGRITVPGGSAVSLNYNPSGGKVKVNTVSAEVAGSVDLSTLKAQFITIGLPG